MCLTGPLNNVLTFVSSNPRPKKWRTTTARAATRCPTLAATRPQSTRDAAIGCHKRLRARHINSRIDRSPHVNCEGRTVHVLNSSWESERKTKDHFEQSKSEPITISKHYRFIIALPCYFLLTHRKLNSCTLFCVRTLLDHWILAFCFMQHCKVACRLWGLVLSLSHYLTKLDSAILKATHSKASDLRLLVNGVKTCPTWLEASKL